MPIQTFRYFVMGASNTVLGLITFYIAFHYIFKEQKLHLGFYAFEPYTASLGISFTVALIWGFFVMKYVVFDDSKIRGHVQFFRYLLVNLLNLSLNWVLLKLTIEFLNIYPTLAQLATATGLIIFSYFAQKHFTFKKDKPIVPDYVE